MARQYYNNGGIIGPDNDPTQNAEVVSTYTGGATFTPAGATVAEVVVVGGGGGGGSNRGGGGGAGGVLYSSAYTLPGSGVPISIGGGGGMGGNGSGSAGGSSAFDSQTAQGGGSGAGHGGNSAGGAGGSGGGAGHAGGPGSPGSGQQSPSGQFTGYGNNGGSGGDPAAGGAEELVKMPSQEHKAVKEFHTQLILLRLHQQLIILVVAQAELVAVPVDKAAEIPGNPEEVTKAEAEVLMAQVVAEQVREDKLDTALLKKLHFLGVLQEYGDFKKYTT